MKQFAVRAALSVLYALGSLRRVVLAVGRIVINPTRAIGRVLLRLSAPLYRLLFTARHRTNSLQNASAGTKFLALLAGRGTIHIVITLLAFGVVANNVSARGSGLADVAGKSVLGHVISPNEDEQDVIERAPAPKTSYLNRANVVSPEVTFEAEIGTPVDAETAMVAAGNALQIPTVSGDGVPQRSDVTTYVVQGGDTIGGIANRYGVTQRTILAANNMTNADFIKPGQELLIPPITGVLHKVAKGDTIASIAQKYKVDAQDILDFNHLADPSAITPDQTIIVPGGELPEVTPSPAPGPQPSRPSPSTGPIPGPAPAIGGGRLNWPTVRKGINQYFRYGHTGIDAECGYGDSLYAAREGTVSAVIYQRYGYGYHIIINHGGNFQTLYGHASKIFVKPGQRVSKGQSIGMCGSTGRSSGTHVHFETFVNGRKVNPLTYL